MVIKKKSLATEINQIEWIIGKCYEGNKNEIWKYVELQWSQRVLKFSTAQVKLVANSV
jgi:hypothetical protein